jgi:uncharacterized protein
MFLLDANVLIALGDADHVHHDRAMRFFGGHAVTGGWATCPLTENAFLRILGHAGYQGGPGSPELARRSLLSIITVPGHQFWPDSVSLADTRSFPSLPPSGRLTDLYLLALAVQRGGRLATLDRRIDPGLISGGPDAYHVIAGCPSSELLP